MPTLTFISPGFENQSVILADGKTTVGRADDNAVVVYDNSVSAHHCEMLVNDHEVILVERGSANGSYVNGARVDGQFPAKDGDLIRFGDVEARLHLGPAEPPMDTEWTAHFVKPGASDPRLSGAAGFERTFPTIIARTTEFQGDTHTAIHCKAPSERSRGRVVTLDQGDSGGVSGSTLAQRNMMPVAWFSVAVVLFLFLMVWLSGQSTP